MLLLGLNYFQGKILKSYRFSNNIQVGRNRILQFSTILLNQKLTIIIDFQEILFDNGILKKINKNIVKK